ncbi:MAG: glycosyltransferase family 2 protein [Candidatus Komeilibacteria bacterium]
MTQNLNKIFVVIPVLNEAKNIGAVLDRFKDYNYTVVVVNDGSTDNTASIVRQYSGVYLVNHFINRGMGAALQTGNEFALSMGAEYIVHFDGDGQMQIEDIDKMLEPLIAGRADITMGSRHMGVNSNLPWLKKYILQPPARIINFLFTGLWLTDVHNGFRAVTAETAKKMYISIDGFAHNTEIPAMIRKLSLKYEEVPVKIIYTKFGLGLSAGFKILFDLIIKKLN